MTEFSDATPVTSGMLRRALEECGLAVGFALAGTVNTAGTNRAQVLAIAESLQTLSMDGRFPGPAGPVDGRQLR